MRSAREVAEEIAAIVTDRIGRDENPFEGVEKIIEADRAIRFPTPEESRKARLRAEMPSKAWDQCYLWLRELYTGEQP